MSYIRPIFLIAGNTVTGVLRGVVLNVLLVLAGLSIIASMSTSVFDAEQTRSIIVDSGLAGITMLGAFIAILTGFTMLPGELETRTAYPVLSKPVRRWQFVLGKFFGAAGVNGITVGLLAILFFVVYFVKMREFDPSLVPAVLMIYAMLVTLSALIVFFSTFMSWIGTIITSMVVWFIGSYSQFFAQLIQSSEQEGGGSSLSVTLFQFMRQLVPNFQAMDIRFDIVQQTPLEPVRLIAPLASAVIFIVIALILAIMIFNKREL